MRTVTRRSIDPAAVDQSSIPLRGQFKKTLEALLTSPATC
ncbi:hypothetical protein BVI434_730014 [Burkholderia vietnamiensis]|nr:hypothetical protein BVI434_730014 [Burkholderia vietnamiensis]